MQSDATIAKMAGQRDNEVGRWAALGPYYAMFPVGFAYRIVSRFTEPGNGVLDPFCGRGTSIFAAASLGRVGTGSEINPVGFVYGATKVAPPRKAFILRRLLEINEIARSEPLDKSLPEFFRFAFAPSVRRFLCVARRELAWKTSAVDRALAALVLVYLHGKPFASLSNQMRQTKAMAPDYSVQWWKTRELRPPHIDPVDFLVPRIEWRYERGIPQLTKSRVILGDSRKVLSSHQIAPWNLMLTSPPYCGITNYRYDQWLRLWFLGGPALPETGHEHRFQNQASYRRLLEDVFGSASESARRNAAIYVRTDAREYTRETTIEVLKSIWPKKRLRVRWQPLKGKSQTDLFGFTSPDSGEVDVVMR